MPTTTNDRPRLHERASRIGFVVAALVSVGFAPVPPPKPRKVPTAEEELKRLQGTWEVAEHFIGDGQVKVRERETTFAFQGAGLSCYSRGSARSSWSVALRPEKSPRAMDLRDGEGKFWPGAYGLEGDRLTVSLSYSAREEDRPTNLKPGRGHLVFVLKRIKKTP